MLHKTLPGLRLGTADILKACGLMPPAPQEFGLCFLGFTGWVVTQDLGLTGSRGDKLCQHMVWGRQGLEETNCDKASSGPDGFL